MADIYGGNARAPGTTSGIQHTTKWPTILIAVAIIAAIIVALIYWAG